MKFKISKMSALALLEHASLDRDLVNQIESAPSKADTLYLHAPIEKIQKARDDLQAFMKSYSQYNKDAYSLILQEVEYLANENEQKLIRRPSGSRLSNFYVYKVTTKYMVEFGDKSNKVATTKGLLSSLFISVPLSYLLYFVLSNIQEIDSELVLLIMGAIPFIAISAHAFSNPLIYLKIAKVLGFVWTISVLVSLIVAMFSLFG